MRRVRSLSLVMLPCLSLALVGCKRREVPAAPPPMPNAPAAAVEETVDALTPTRPNMDLAQRADTVNGDPNGPKQAELDAAQADGQRKLQACLDTLPPKALPGGMVRLVVRYVIGTEGKARDVTVEGGGPEANACGKTALEGVAFPKFQGAALSNAFSLTYSRPQTPDLSTTAH